MKEAEEFFWNDDDSVEVWLAGLSKNEMGIIFQLLLQGESQAAEQRVKSEFLAWRIESGTDTSK